MSPITPVLPIQIADLYIRNQFFKFSKENKNPEIKEEKPPKEEGKGDLIDIFT